MSNQDGCSPLTIAYSNNNFEIADFLASKGAEYNKYETVESPLIYASKFGDLSRVKQYLSEGIDVNIRDSDDKTPLIYALEKINENDNYNDIVNLLIDNGADIKIKYDWNTILHMAVKGKSDIRFIEKLISSGFNVNDMNIPSLLFILLY